MKVMTRDAAISALRAELLRIVDDEHSICEVAGRRGIYCHGFAQWTFSELRKRYPTIVRSRPRITPAELRDLANRWQIARQTARGTLLACDTQVEEGALRTCKGWEEWTSSDLERFHRELTGEEIEIVPADRTHGSS
jgi:hypothetical protein